MPRSVSSTITAPFAASDVSQLLPNEHDVAEYERCGWWISPQIIPHDLIDEAADAAARFQAGERDRTLPLQGGFSDWRPGPDAPLLRNNEFVSLQSVGLARLSLQPIIGAIAAHLARTSAVRLFDDQLISKPPSADARDDADSAATAVGWHADHAYWGTCSSDDMLTAWIPFHDVDEERGAMVVIDGSHRWRLEHSRHFTDTDMAGLPERLAADGHEVVCTPLTLRKGQVSFHHCWTLHGSLPNRSPLPRTALAVHLQDADNGYRPATRLDGSPVVVVNELLARRTAEGLPDFSDPAVFPSLWAAPGQGVSR